MDESTMVDVKTFVAHIDNLSKHSARRYRRTAGLLCSSMNLVPLPVS